MKRPSLHDVFLIDCSDLSAPMEITAVRFGEEEAILLNLVHLQEEPGTEGETAGSSAAGDMGGAVRRRRRRGVKALRRTRMG